VDSKYVQFDITGTKVLAVVFHGSLSLPQPNAMSCSGKSEFF